MVSLIYWWPLTLPLFWVQVRLRQKYYTPQVWPYWNSNPWPPDHDSTLQVPETPAPTPLLSGKCAVMIRKSWVRTSAGSNFGCIVLLSESHLNLKYQLPVHQSIWEPVKLKSPQTSRVMWQNISFQVPNGWVVTTIVSETWNILSWSGGHGLEPWLHWTWGV